MNCAPRLVRHGDRLAEVSDRLLEGGAAQSLVAGLAPPFNRQIVDAGLGEMMGDASGSGDALSPMISAAGDGAPGGGS